MKWRGRAQIRRAIKENFTRWFWLTLVLIAFVIICADNYAKGWDFDVFYRAALAVLDGISPYTLGRDTGWTYKYPPWSLSIFLPFTALNFLHAKFVWGLIQCVCLVHVFQTIRKNGVSRGVAVAGFVPFWFLIHHHALSGQINVLILALSVGVQRDWLLKQNLKSNIRFAGVFWALSLKVFSVFPLVGLFLEGLPWRTFAKKILWSLLLFLLLSLPVFWLTHKWPLDLFWEWKSAASILSSNEITWAPSRAWNNAGLPGALLRMLNVPYTALHWDLITSLGLGVLLGGLWQKYTRTLSWSLRWSGWLAIGTIIHPLVWMMSYVQVIPLSCYALHEVKNARIRWRWWVYLLGVILTTLITSNTFRYFGITALNGIAESISVKAWGTLLLGLSVMRTSPSK